MGDQGFSREQCCSHYIKQAETGGSGIFLPTFRGSGASGQQGHGFVSQIWKSFVYPHVVQPLLTQFIVPKVKKLLGERVLPSVRRSVSDIYGDLRSGNKGVNRALNSVQGRPGTV